jgi:hypothetical protein
MNKILITLALSVFANFSIAQDIQSKEKYPIYRLTTEPAIGTHLTMSGAPDLQVSNLLQYNINRRIGLISHTAISFGFPMNRMADIIQNYNYSLYQKFGIGTSFHIKNTVHVISVLGGIKYNAYSGTLSNDQIPEHITTKTNSITSDYGFMYNLKLIRRKYFLSTRLYIPAKDGLAGIGENTTIEIGVGIRLK